VKQIGGATWTWSGDPLEADSRNYLADGFRINGSLDSDTEVVLANVGAASLQGVLLYNWKGITPCPAMLPGCKPCPSSAQVCQGGLHAVCDGSATWKCSSTLDPLPAVATTTTAPPPTTSNAPRLATTTAHPQTSVPPLTTSSTTRESRMKTVPAEATTLRPKHKKDEGSTMQPPAAPVDNSWLSPGSIIAAFCFLLASIAVGATAGCVALHMSPKESSRVAPSAPATSGANDQGGYQVLNQRTG